MTLEQELELSYYRTVAPIHEAASIGLVQDIRTRKFYVQKQLTTYQPEIYRYLQQHPIANTPRILLVAEEAQVLTVIEEYIPGDTLEELLVRHGTLPEAQVLDIGVQLCRILSEFHHCHPPIVNRDIKPANLILTPDGVLKLLDMNTAKREASQAPADTVLLGTRGYAAPEQYGFGPSSVLSDLYAVGVILNVMLCGKFPNEKIAQGSLGPVIRKCTQLSPAARYRTIDELLETLELLCPSTPSGPKPWRRFLPPGFRAPKPVRHIFSTLGYLMVFYCGFTLEVPNAPITELVLNRIFITLMLLSVIFFNGNYLGVHSSFRLTKSRHRLVRWMGMALVDLALMCCWVILLDLAVIVFQHF